MTGASHNEHTGSTGNVVQAGAIHGDIHFHHPPALARHRVLVCAVGGDRTWADWICGTLTACGYAAERQSWRFVAGEDLRARIAVMDGDERIVLLFSRVSMRSPYYNGPWLDDLLGQERTLVVQVEDVTIETSADAVIRPHDSEKAALACLRGALAARRWPCAEHAGTGGTAYPGRGPKVNNLPPRNPGFTGRADVLNRVATWLLAEEEETTGCVLLGMSGVGKTQAALEYAHRYRCHYDLIWRVVAEEPSTVNSDLGALARHLGVKDITDPRAMMLGLRQRLAEYERWLIVFDNAEEVGLLRECWPGADGHVIITSNRNLDWRSLAVKECRLDVFTDADAVTFLRKRLNWPDGDAVGREIADELGRLPLALAQAAGYISGSRCLPDEYLALLRDRMPELLDNDEDGRRTVSATLRLALRKVRTHNPAAERLLGVCAFLASEGISRALFTDHSASLPPELRPVVEDRLAYGRALEMLRRYSLIDVEGRTLSVHRLVQVIARDTGHPEQADAAVRLVADAFPPDPLSAGAHVRCSELLPHAMAVRRFRHSPVVHDELVGLLVRCGVHLAEWQQPRQALEVLGQAQAMLGDEPTAELAGLLAASGRAHFELADLGIARITTEGALRILTDLHGADAPETLYPLHRLGSILIEQADLDGALTLVTHALTIAPTRAAIWDSFGTVFWRQGRNTEALAMYTKALAMMDEDGTGIDTAQILNNLATVHRELGNMAEAWRSQTRAKDIFLEQFGERGMPVARVRIGLARILLKYQRFPDAQAEAAAGVEVLEEWQADHPNTALGLNVLGDTLRALGRPAEAVRLHIRARQIYARTYGPDHPYNAEALRRLGMDHCQAGDLRAAEETLIEAVDILTGHYGPGYPRAALAVAALAAVRAQQ